MARRKKVTPKTIAANRQNAQKSTGPRSEEGKANSRLNAVKHGVFASSVPIPFCDGPGCEERFSSSITELALELKPMTPLEWYCVRKIGEYRWKADRVTRAEAASIRSAVASCEAGSLMPAISRVRKCLSEDTAAITVLTKAKEELQRKGKLKKKTQNEVAPLMANQSGTDSNFDIDSDFPRRLDSKISELQMRIYAGSTEAQEMPLAHVVKVMLPAGEDLDRIVRYDSYTQSKIAFALRMLWELQQRRQQRAKGEEDTRRGILARTREM
jgi:hypothetical protein